MAITFDQLRLLVAISHVDGSVPDKTDDRLAYVYRVRDEYCRMSGDCCFPYSASEVSDLALTYRKNTTTRMKAKIASAHGAACFWAERGKGPCDNEAEAGHICPACEGNDLTVYNGMIECRAHNNQRRTMTIEEYLLAHETTSTEASNEDSPSG